MFCHALLGGGARYHQLRRLLENSSLSSEKEKVMGAVYNQLSITERRRIERWRHAKVPVDEMVRVLKRCRSTIFRESKRNHFSDECMPGCDGYYGAAAQLMMADRRAGPQADQTP
tara:strand:- start:59 stop:403 length:345 start_codon:yes stop_codon:yes gene_type:complete